jgi:hypothetical protein
MHDTPVDLNPAQAAKESQVLELAEKLLPRDEEPLEMEQPHTLQNHMRLLKAHAQGPEAFRQEWDKVQAENRARNNPSTHHSD